MLNALSAKEHARIQPSPQPEAPWFWKIFGGAIIGLISILLIGYINNINMNMDRVFFELRGDIKELRQQNESQMQRITTYEVNNAALREEVKALRETDKDITRQVQDVREKLATELGTRKAIQKQ